MLVVGNPANTNALIALSHAPDLDPRQFHAMTRLDHNRAMSQLGAKVGRPVTAIKKMTIWGNHSTTQYPDLFHCEVDGQNAAAMVDDQAWIETSSFRPLPSVERRSSRLGAPRRPPQPQTPRSITCTTGRWVRLRATGCRWRSTRMARTACQKASFRASRRHVRMGTSPSCKVSTSTSSAEHRIDASAGELVSERDTVRASGSSEPSSGPRSGALADASRAAVDLGGAGFGSRALLGQPELR